MNHLMIDLETMGNKPSAPIVSIGAVIFDPSTGEFGPDFYRVVSLKSSVDGGAVPDADTIMWWMQQSEEARHQAKYVSAIWQRLIPNQNVSEV